MPSFGGYSPFPRQHGGGNEQIALVTKAIQAGRGNGITQEQDSYVWAESLSFAREVWGAWGTNRRLGNIWDPTRCPWEIFERWERLMAIPRDSRDQPTTRRARLVHRWGLWGREFDWGFVYEEAESVLGDMFIQLDTISLDNATMIVPDGTYPWGIVVDAATPWASTTMKFLLHVEAVEGQTEAQFYQEVGKIVQAMNPILPAWMSFDWYRSPVDYAPIAVVGGPSAGGFYLDDPHNLDNAVFDE